MGRSHAELCQRDVIRTNNNPVGDIAEAIVHGHYGGERASFSQAGWDVLTPEGERIQVKAARNTPTNKRTNLSPIRDREYDSVVAVLFDEDFQITDALKVSREVAEELATFKAINGHVPTSTACSPIRASSTLTSRTPTPGSTSSRSTRTSASRRGSQELSGHNASRRHLFISIAPRVHL